MKKIYRVTLSVSDRDRLRKLLKAKVVSALKVTRARILLKADQSDAGACYSDAEISEALDVSAKTVFNIRKKWAELGLDAALERCKQASPSRLRKLDAAGEAKLIATVCGPAPKGRAAWTLELLAGEVVRLKIAPSICRETIRQTLKKTKSSLG